jgi:hypothetical protein
VEWLKEMAERSVGELSRRITVACYIHIPTAFSAGLHT